MSKISVGNKLSIDDFILQVSKLDDIKVIEKVQGNKNKYKGVYVKNEKTKNFCLKVKDRVFIHGVPRHLRREFSEIIENIEKHIKTGSDSVDSPQMIKVYTPTVIDGFKGRKKEIKSIDKAFKDRKIAIICGESGQGKTTLAEQFLYDEYSNDRTLKSICRIEFDECEKVTFGRLLCHFISANSHFDEINESVTIQANEIIKGNGKESSIEDIKRNYCTLMVNKIKNQASYLFIDNANKMNDSEFADFIKELNNQFKDKINILITTQHEPDAMALNKSKVEVINLSDEKLGEEDAWTVFINHYTSNKKERKNIKSSEEKKGLFCKFIYDFFGGNIRAIVFVAEIFAFQNSKDKENLWKQYKSGGYQIFEVKGNIDEDKHNKDEMRILPIKLANCMAWLNKNSYNSALNKLWNDVNVKLVLLIAALYEQTAIRKDDVDNYLGIENRFSSYANIMNPYFRLKGDTILMHPLIAKALCVAISDSEYKLELDEWLKLTLAIQDIKDDKNNNYSLNEDNFNKISDKIKEQLKNNEVIEIKGSVGYKTFYGLTATEEVKRKVIISEGAAKIGESAFCCSDVCEITIPSSVEKICAYAFSGCDMLSKVNLPDDSNLSIIEEKAFYACESLKEIKIPSNVKMIGDEAFSELKNLETVFYNAVRAEIGSLVLDESKENLKNIIFGNKVQYIDDELFSYLPQLTEIQIPASVEEIVGWAFSSCQSLKKVTFEEGSKLKFIGKGDGCNNYWIGGPFYDLPQLTEIQIPASVEEIGAYAFSKCRSLKKVTFEEGSKLKFIGISAFCADNRLKFNCKNGLCYLGTPNNKLFALIQPKILDGSGDSLYENESYIKIEKDTKIIAKQAISCFYAICSIGAGTVYYGAKLESIIVDPDNEKYSSIDNCLIDKTNKTLIKGCKNSIIPNGVKIIEPSAFEGSLISKIVIPSSVEIIGAGALSGCSNLDEVYFDKGIELKVINRGSFSGCRSLKNIELPASVERIEGNVFSGCSELQRLSVDEKNKVYYSQDNCIIESDTKKLIIGCKNSVIPKDIKVIGERAFYDRKNLTKIEIPNSVRVIEESAFSFTGLKTLVLPENIELIKSAAFSDQIETKEWETVRWNAINCQTENRGDYIFGMESHISSLYIGSKVKSFPSGLVHSWHIQEIHIDDIGAWCAMDFNSSDDNPLGYAQKLFIGENETKNLIIPNGVSLIKPNTFCRSVIEEISVPASVTDIGESAFMWCLHLKNVKFCEGSLLKHISQWAFSYSAIKSVEIPDGVTVIDEFAFNGCYILEEITIPESLEKIGKFAFGRPKGSSYLRINYCGTKDKFATLWANSIELNEKFEPVTPFGNFEQKSFVSIECSDGPYDFDGMV